MFQRSWDSAPATFRPQSLPRWWASAVSDFGGLVMRRGMARMDMVRRLKAHRTLSLILTFLTLVGWGAFAVSAGSAAIATRDLRAELAQLKASQDQVLAERNQQQAAAGDLAQAQAKLASAREDLDILAHKRERRLRRLSRS